MNPNLGHPNIYCGLQLILSYVQSKKVEIVLTKALIGFAFDDFLKFL